ncbi:macrophage mannose receptor 1-like isoform X2 [Amblyomma americanum]
MKSIFIVIPLCFTGARSWDLPADWFQGRYTQSNSVARVDYSNGGNCPEDWIPFGENCYWFASNESRLMYFQALKHCKSQNARLVTVPTEKEQKFLMSRLYDATTNLWIGLERLPNNTWTWIDGSSVEYTNWIIGQPRETGGDCNEILTGTLHPGRWNQVRCNVKRMHVCQKKRDKSLPPQPVTPSESRCDLAYPGSFGYRSSCYRMGDYQDWKTAVERCQGLGGHLAHVRDIFEDAFLSVKFNFRGGLYWIGLQDAKGTGLFSWTSGWPVHYTSWAPLQPPASTGELRCVAADLATGLWSVQPCHTALPYLCQFESEEPPKVEHHDRPCPEHARNWIDVGNPQCYSLETERIVSFNESITICNGKNSTLASFHSKDQIDRLRPYLSKSQHPVWIGLASAYNDSFQWLDGSPLDYEHWKQGEPSHADENCVEMRQFDGLWNDAYCHAKNGFLCAVEKDPQRDETEGAAPNSAGKPSAGVYVAVALGALLVLVATAFAIQQVVRYVRLRRQARPFSFENNVYIDPPVYDTREGSMDLR